MNNTFRITGPYTFENLSLFLLHGKDRVPAGSYRALEPAMEAKGAAVYETGEVGSLEIENLSDLDVFVQAGDMVKGGRQDRVIGVDFILGKHSGRVPIPTFCVEKARWHRRGPEDDRSFSSSHSYLSAKSLKHSTKVSACQSDVWHSVHEEQAKLCSAVNDSSVMADVSKSSYQLSIEHAKVQEKVLSCVDALRDKAASETDAIGFVFAINDELNSADVYANHDLFQQLWSKLLNAAATEAVAESRRMTGDSGKKVTADDIARFLEKQGLTARETQSVTPRVQLRQYANEKKFRFETEDLERDAVCVHVNVVSS